MMDLKGLGMTSKQILEQVSEGKLNSLKRLTEGNRATFKKYGLEPFQKLILLKRGNIYTERNRIFTEPQYKEILAAYPEDEREVGVIIIELTY